MLNRAVRRFRGPILVQPEQLNALFSIVDQVRSTEGLWKNDGVIIKVDYSDDESYTLDNPEDILRLKNRHRKYIKSIRFSWPFGSNNASIQVGGGWWRRSGAELEVQAPPTLSAKMIEEFEDVFGGGKDLFLGTLSLPSYLLAALYVLVLHLCVGLISTKAFIEIFKAFHKDSSIILYYLLNGWITPIILVELFIGLGRTRLIGNAVFYWGGGINRYKNHRAILVFLGAALPLAVLSARFFG